MRRSILSTVVAMVLLSCVSDGDSGPVCERFVAKVEGCNIARAGDISCFEPSTDRGRCVAQCELKASCAAIGEQLCFHEALDDALSDCMSTCAQRHVGVDCYGDNPSPECRTCPSSEPIGGGTTISVNSLCDGFEDCSDGSDEDGCPTLTCDDGTLTSDHHRCDGTTNCSDGSDEVGCAILICENPSDEGVVRVPWR